MLQNIFTYQSNVFSLLFNQTLTIATLNYDLWISQKVNNNKKKKTRNFNTHTYLYRYQTVSNIEPIFKSGYFGLTNHSWGRIFWKGNKICLLTSFISSISLLAAFFAHFLNKIIDLLAIVFQKKKLQCSR